MRQSSAIHQTDDSIDVGRILGSGRSVERNLLLTVVVLSLAVARPPLGNDGSFLSDLYNHLDRPGEGAVSAATESWLARALWRDSASILKNPIRDSTSTKIQLQDGATVADRGLFRRLQGQSLAELAEFEAKDNPIAIWVPMPESILTHIANLTLGAVVTGHVTCVVESEPAPFGSTENAPPRFFVSLQYAPPHQPTESDWFTCPATEHVIVVRGTEILSTANSGLKGQLAKKWEWVSGLTIPQAIKAILDEERDAPLTMATVAVTKQIVILLGPFVLLAWQVALLLHMRRARPFLSGHYAARTFPWTYLYEETVAGFWHVTLLLILPTILIALCFGWSATYVSFSSSSPLLLFALSCISAPALAASVVNGWRLIEQRRSVINVLRELPERRPHLPSFE